MTLKLTGYRYFKIGSNVVHILKLWNEQTGWENQVDKNRPQRTFLRFRVKKPSFLNKILNSSFKYQHSKNQHQNNQLILFKYLVHISKSTFVVWSKNIFQKTEMKVAEHFILRKTSDKHFFLLISWIRFKRIDLALNLSFSTKFVSKSGSFILSC